MDKTVLITGASGLIGKSLTEQLLLKGYKVHVLSRSERKDKPGLKSFVWNVEEQKIDPHCLDGVDAIINLAGEGIADKAWTRRRKQQIVKSRTGAINLLNELLRESNNHQVKDFISASAVGHYGDRGDELLSEDAEPGTDFLANACLAWERAADKVENLGLRLVVLRIGVVLSANGGALPKLVQPLKMGFGAALGSGAQWMPWIHIEDLVNMFIYSLENRTLRGVFNAIAPAPETNSNFTRKLARQLKKPLWMPPVPGFAIKLLMGEMSAVVLNSNRVSAEKISQSGFNFKYNRLEDALKEIYGDY